MIANLNFEKNSAVPFIIGVAGGSGSGKTYFSSALKAALKTDHCEIVFQDNFYFDQSANFDFDGGSVNYDHPDAIDFELLEQCLVDLKQGKVTHLPVYDFVTHKRLSRAIQIPPKPVIVVDGILVLQSPLLRRLFDHKVFVDTPENLRFSRRLARDVDERGRTEEGVRSQFLKQVKPMHDEFVEPSKVHADVMIYDDGKFDDLVAAYRRQLAT